MWTFKGTKFSATNTIGYLLLLTVVIITFFQGRYAIAGITLAATIASAWLIKHAKNSESNELWRIIMFEPEDERDRIISTKAMAMVLQFDIWVGLIVGLGYTLFATPNTTGGLIVLSIELLLLLKLIVFAIASWIYSRRL